MIDFDQRMFCDWLHSNYNKPVYTSPQVHKSIFLPNLQIGPLVAGGGGAVVCPPPPPLMNLICVQVNLTGENLTFPLGVKTVVPTNAESALVRKRSHVVIWDVHLDAPNLIESWRATLGLLSAYEGAVLDEHGVVLVAPFHPDNILVSEARSLEIEIRLA